MLHLLTDGKSPLIEQVVFDALILNGFERQL
jgi:hypothetical protein